MKLLMIDNFDSFTYNLVQYFQTLNCQVDSIRNDAITESEITEKIAAYNAVVISPGPSNPEHAGISVPVIKAAIAAQTPLLGVCLGHQAIAYALGGKIVRCDPPAHGKVGQISHFGKNLYKGLPNPLPATRYHSLVAEPQSLPQQLEVDGVLSISSNKQDDIIMSFKHKSAPVYGLQFHPESILTPQGMQMLKNFVDL